MTPRVRVSAAALMIRTLEDYGTVLDVNCHLMHSPKCRFSLNSWAVLKSTAVGLGILSPNVISLFDLQGLEADKSSECNYHTPVLIERRMRGKWSAPVIAMGRSLRMGKWITISVISHSLDIRMTYNTELVPHCTENTYSNATRGATVGEQYDPSKFFRYVYEFVPL